MKLLRRLFPLLACLSLFCSMTGANGSDRNHFNFLNTSLENATLVENGLVLAESIGGVSLSTLINTGLWWGVCKIPGVISGLANKYQYTETEKKELESIKTDFCLHLAPLVATTETALAGPASPWPLEQLWWRSLFWGGAALSAYAGYTLNENIRDIPVAIMVFLTSGRLSRSLSSGVTTSLLRRAGKTSIDGNYYNLGEYTVLAITSGLMTGAIIYEALLYKRVRLVKAGFISVVSAAIAGALSGGISVANIDFSNRQVKVMHAVRAGALTGVGTLVGASFGTLTETITVTVALAGAGAFAGELAGAATGAGAGSLAGAATGAGALMGVLGGVGVITGINRLVQTKPALAITASVVTATVVTLINSISGYVAHGYPLEQGFSETSQALWKKLYAPMDYLSTLFQ